MKLKIFSLILITGLLFSCNEDILDYQNPGAYDEATYFKSPQQMKNAIMATYGVMLHRGMHARDWYFIFDLMSSDAMKNTFALGDDADYYNFSFSPSQLYVNEVWNSLFRMRTRAAIVVEKADQFVAANEEEKNQISQIKGEAYFLKSYAYFRLVQIYGDVPYTETWTEIKNEENFKKARTPKAEIFAHIETDLANAITLLPEAWGSSDLGRATKYAAIALLGKVYLEQGKYQEALVEFTKIKDSGKFSMWDGPQGFSKQFLPENSNSPETIFDVRHGDWKDWAQGNPYYMFGGQESWGNGAMTHSGRAMEFGFRDWWNVFISTGAVNSFKYPINGLEYTDPRAGLTFYGGPGTGGDMDWKGGEYDFNKYLTSWKKYERYESVLNEGVPTSNINTQIIRYADVLLMMAECHFFQDQFSQGLEYINLVRKRVGATPYASAPTTFDEAFTILERERRLELTGEQVRWFDLKRWELASRKATGFSMIGRINADRAQDQVNKPAPITQKYIYLPIPNREMDNNPNVVNNINFENWN